MTSRRDTIFMITLVVCAVATTATVLYQQFSRPASLTAQLERDPVLVDSWEDLLEAGLRSGPPEAAVRLIEFADFECPYCADFHKRLKALRATHPAQVSVTFIHFPLDGHRFALSAARASECAAEQGHFEAMQDQLFAGQQSFGLQPWKDYAKSAGVPDLAAFDACVGRTEHVARIESGKLAGARLDIKGTPTLIVNGWRLPSPPTAEVLDAMVKAVVDGKSPISVIGGRSEVMP